MKRISEYKKLFNISQEITLAQLKSTYRNLMKEWHPDKFVNDEEGRAEAETISKTIIEAYHFLVSIAPETHAANLEEYTLATTTLGIDDIQHKGLTLKITFQGGSVYEYFGVQKPVFIKLINSPSASRFARRHIFHSYLYRKASNESVAV